MAHKTFHCWIVVHCWRKTKRSEMETKECVLDCAFWRCIGVFGGERKRNGKISWLTCVSFFGIIGVLVVGRFWS